MDDLENFVNDPKLVNYLVHHNVVFNIREYARIRMKNQNNGFILFLSKKKKKNIRQNKNKNKNKNSWTPQLAFCTKVNM